MQTDLFPLTYELSFTVGMVLLPCRSGPISRDVERQTIPLFFIKKSPTKLPPVQENTDVEEVNK